MKKYIFGYGSLVNNRSRNTTLKRNSESIITMIHKDFGYIRKWNYYDKNINKIALGLEKNINGDYINGILFNVEESELIELDQREIGYERIIIPNKFVNCHNLILSEEIIIYTYIPTDEFIIKEINKNKDNKKYLNICCDGFIKYGESFFKQFYQYTYDWDIYYKHI
jgi:hypothetical protein